MTQRAHDRGLKAVARVREVRERDSRIGLLQSLTLVRTREKHLEDVNDALAQAMLRTASTLDDFVVSRSLLSAMASAVRDAERSLEHAQTVAAEAHRRWQADKTKVHAIEHLLEERSLRRAEEARRADQREVDDIVGRLHARAALASSGRHGMAS